MFPKPTFLSATELIWRPMLWLVVFIRRLFQWQKMLSATFCDFNYFFRDRTPVFACIIWYCLSDVVIAINFVRLQFCQSWVYFMIVIKWCGMLQSLVTHMVIFSCICGQTSPLSVYELNLMSSCCSLLRRLCRLSHLPLSTGGPAFSPPKACSSPPRSPGPQPYLAPRPSQ